MIEIFRQNTNTLDLTNLKNLGTGELLSTAAVTFDIRDMSGSVVYSGILAAAAQAGAYVGSIPSDASLPGAKYKLEIEANAGPGQVLHYDETLVVSDRPADVF